MRAPRIAGTARLDVADVPVEAWLAEAGRLYREGWWFEALWSTPDPRVFALWGRPGELRLLRLTPVENAFPSLTTLIPAADWFERALRDRTGLVPKGHVDPRSFLFHETYPAGYVDGQPLPPLTPPPGPEYPFLRHEGPGVFELPVGPIHAGVIEPGHFRFTTVGEIILDLEVRLNYTYKGTLTLAQGKSLEHALRLLERLSGDNAAAHATAFAAACEAAAEIEPDPAAQDLRSGLVELERVYNHLGDLAGIAIDVALPSAASHFQTLREECLRWNGRLVGHRLLMNVIAVGGLHRMPEASAWAAFQAALAGIRRRFEQAVTIAVNHSGLKERVEGTGHLSRASAELLACVGPAARATGVARDARRDAPCLAYPRRPLAVVTRAGGTVSDRMWVRVEEIRASLEWLAGLSQLHPVRPSAVDVGSASGDGLALVEASRGAVLSWVRLVEGRVKDVYQRDPSFLNWRGLEEAVLRNIVPDFPLINKSFNLSYSGSDA